MLLSDSLFSSYEMLAVKKGASFLAPFFN